MSQIASASASPFTFSFKDPSTGATNAADTSPADFARLSLSAQMAAITADGVNLQAGTSGQLLVGTPADQALFTMANGAVTSLAVPSGFELAPANIDAATFESFADAVKSAYLSYNGLPANATIGTGTAAFPGYLASAKASPFAFIFGGRVDTSLSDFEALDAATRATLVSGYGADGALLVGTPDGGEAAFTLAADGSVSETREPAGFALLPYAMDAATYGAFTSDERAMYLRLNGLGAGSALGTPPFPAYPAASLAAPTAFLDASDRPATSLASFDALSPALKALAVSQAGGTLLAGTAGSQALFTVDGNGNLTRTAVPPGFALTPAAMDFGTYASLGSAVQALYLAFNGKAATDTLGTAASQFLPSASGMTSAAWSAMSAGQRSDYLSQHGLSNALLSPPSTATPAPSGAMTAAQWQGLTPAERTFFAQAYGLSTALTTATGDITAAIWTNLENVAAVAPGVSGQGALYLSLNGLDPSFAAPYDTAVGVSAYAAFTDAQKALYLRLNGVPAAVMSPPSTAMPPPGGAMTAAQWQALTPAQRTFFAQTFGLSTALATAPAAMTAATWAGITGLAAGPAGVSSQSALYLALNGLDPSLSGDPTSSPVQAAYPTFSAASRQFLAQANGLPDGYALLPSAMTAEAWAGLAAPQKTAYLALTGLGMDAALPPQATRLDQPLSGFDRSLAGLSADELAFFLRVNGLPTGFAVAPANMTPAIWSSLTAEQRSAYVAVAGHGRSGLSIDSAVLGAQFPLTASASQGGAAAYAGLTADDRTFVAEVSGLPAAFGLAPGAMAPAAWATLTAAQRGLFLQVNGLSGALATPASTMAPAVYTALGAADLAFLAAANGLPAAFNTAPAAMTPAAWTQLTDAQRGTYLGLNGLSAALATPATIMMPAAYAALKPIEQVFFGTANGLPTIFTTAPAAMTSAVWAQLTAGQQGTYLQVNGLSNTLATPISSLTPAAYAALKPAEQSFFDAANGLPAAFTTAPAAMTSVAWAQLTAAQQGTYLQVNGLSSALATPASALTSASYAPLSAAERTFFDAANGLPAAFDTTPAAVTSALWSQLTAAQQNTYLRLNGLSAALATPASSMAPAAYAALGGADLSFFEAANGLPSTFATAPAAVTSALWFQLTAAQQNTYLRLNGLSAALATPASSMAPAAYAALGGADLSFFDAVNGLPTAFNTAPADMTSTVWAQLTAAQQGTYLLVNQLSSALATPASTMAPSAYAALSIAEQAFLAAANGLPTAFATIPADMTSALWGGSATFTDGQKALYLALNGLDPSLSDPYNAGSVRRAYPTFSAVSRLFLARANGLSDAYALQPSAMTADAWAQLSAGQKAYYLITTGLDGDAAGQATQLDQPLSAFNRSLAGLSADELAFFLRVNTLPAGFALPPAAMTSAVWSTLTAAQRTSYVAVAGHDASGLQIDAQVLGVPFPLTASASQGDLAAYAGLSAGDKAFVGAVNDLSAAFAIAPSAMTTAVFETMTLDQESLYLVLNAVDAATAAKFGVTRTTDAGGSYTGTFTSTTIQGPPPEFGVSTTQMTPTTWSGLAPDQQGLYLQKNGLSAALLTPAAAMTQGAYASLSPSERAFFARINGLGEPFSKAPADMEREDWTGGNLTAAAQATYLRLNGLSPNAGATPSTLDRSASAPLPPDEMAFFARVNGLPSSFTRPPSATLGPTAVMDAVAFEDIGRSDPNVQAAYLTLNGLPLYATIGAPPFVAFPSSTFPSIKRTPRSDTSVFSPTTVLRQDGLSAQGSDTLPYANSYATVSEFRDLVDDEFDNTINVNDRVIGVAIRHGKKTYLTHSLGPMHYAIVGQPGNESLFYTQNGLSSTTVFETPLSSGFAIKPDMMTASTFASMTLEEQSLYLSFNAVDRASAAKFGVILASDGASTFAAPGMPAGLLPSFFTLSMNMTLTIWTGLSPVQRRLYIQLNGLPGSLLTPAAYITTGAYAALSPSEQALFATINGLPSAFTTSPPAMTNSVWTDSTFTSAQKALYLGLHGLASNDTTPAASMTSTIFEAMSDADRAFFVMANGLPSNYLIAPPNMTQATFNTFPNGGADYLALYGVSRTGTIGTPPIQLSYSSYCTLERSFSIASVDKRGAIAPGVNLPLSDRDTINPFDDLALNGSYVSIQNFDESTPHQAYVYGQSNYIYQYGHADLGNTVAIQTYRLLIGSPGSQNLYTDAATVDAQNNVTHNVTHVPVSAAFGFAPANMDAATFASMSGAEQAAYVAYWRISTAADGQRLVAGAMTLASGQQIDASLMPASVTASGLAFDSAILPPAPYSPPSSPALSDAEAAKASNAEKEVTAGRSFHLTPYGSAIGPDMLGSAAVQATADALFPVQDGTDADSRALVAALSSSDAAAYASDPSSLSAQIFENWPSQVQLAYLHKHAGSASNGVFAIGPSGAQIHAFAGTPPNASVAPKIYIAETLSKTDVASMVFVDQQKLCSIPTIDTIAQGLGLAAGTDATKAVQTLLDNAYKFIVYGRDGSNSIKNENWVNGDDKNVFIAEINLLASQLLGLKAPSAPTPGTGTGKDSTDYVKGGTSAYDKLTPALQLTGTQTGGSLLFSTATIQAQLTAIEARFKRMAAFAQQARTADPNGDYPTHKSDYSYSMADKDVSTVNVYNSLSQQEFIIASAAIQSANLATTMKGSGTKDLDLPTLICLFELDANASQQAIVKGDTLEVDAVNTLLGFYAQAQTIVNDCAATTTPNDDKSTVAFTQHADQAPADASGLENMMAQNSYLSPIEILYGVSRPTIDTSSQLKNSYWSQMATNLSTTVTQINQQSQAKMNDITSENKQADRYFDLANTALSKMSDTLQKIAGTS